MTDINEDMARLDLIADASPEQHATVRAMLERVAPDLVEYVCGEAS